MGNYTNRFTPIKLNESQKGLIEDLLSYMDQISDTIEKVGLPQKEVSWTSDLYEHVMASIGGDIDSDERVRFTKEESAMSYESIIISIKHRITTMLEYIEIKQEQDEKLPFAYEDVVKVAKSIKVTLTDEQIQSVMSLYPEAAEMDPTGSWFEVLEHVIYQEIE